MATANDKKIAQLEKNKKTAMSRLRMKATEERHTIVATLTGTAIGMLENTEIGRKIPQLDTFGVAGTIAGIGIFAKLLLKGKLGKDINHGISGALAVAGYKAGISLTSALQTKRAATPGVQGFDPDMMGPIDEPIAHRLVPEVMGAPLPIFDEKFEEIGSDEDKFEEIGSDEDFETVDTEEFAGEYEEV